MLIKACEQKALRNVRFHPSQQTTPTADASRGEERRGTVTSGEFQRLSTEIYGNIWKYQEKTWELIQMEARLIFSNDLDLV